MRASNPLSVEVLAYDACIAAELFAVADMLAMANAVVAKSSLTSAMPFTVSVVSTSGHVVRTSAGVCITPRKASRRADVLIVPGFNFAGSDELFDRLARCEDEVRWIKGMARLNKRIAGVCVGSFLLGEAGVLRSRTATTAWIVGGLFANRYPLVRLDLDRLLVRDGRVWTSGAVTAAYDLSLELVREQCGDAAATLLGKITLLDGNRLQSPYVLADVGTTTSDLVARACHIIRRRVATPFDLGALAKACKTSTRTLGRRFREELDCSPLQFAHKVRVERAKALLETTRLRVQDIPARVGYGDETTFRQIFTRHTGMTPSTYRQRFGRRSLLSSHDMKWA